MDVLGGKIQIEAETEFDGLTAVGSVVLRLLDLRV